MFMMDPCLQVFSYVYNEWFSILVTELMGL